MAIWYVTELSCIFLFVLLVWDVLIHSILEWKQQYLTEDLGSAFKGPYAFHQEICSVLYVVCVENRVLCVKREEVIREWRKVHNEVFH